MKDVIKWVMYGAVFAVPFVLLMVSSTMFFPYITGKNFSFRILVEIAFAVWFLLALYDQAYRPRFSWLLVAIAGLVGVMLLADTLGEYAPKSLWSNFERMEGWITLLHFFLYFLVLGSVLRSEKLWNWFLNTALLAAVMMSLYALGQIGGAFEVSQGTAWRVDARLGNSSYLGVYMLFHMMIAAWLFLRAKATNLRWAYGILFFLFAFILFHTGTRGSILGLFGGSILAFGYLALMAEKGAVIKKWALIGLCSVVILGGTLFVLRDTSFVRGNVILSRFTNISLAEGGIRFTVWKMALEGVKERPVLGWGQENFNYVFNKYYDPALYRAEAWYDRTHNILLDWLIAGGVLGLLAYLSILVMALWYAVLRPAIARWKTGLVSEDQFTVAEQALILGLLAAYTFHNLFVFDNLASWIFYAVILAFIHSRVSRPVGSVERFAIKEDTWQKVVVPSVSVVAAVIVYFVNVPGILAAKDIIDAYRETTVAARLNVFETALSRGSFADQEIVEQMAQIGGQAASVPNISDADRTKIREEVDKAFSVLIAEKPEDARLYVVRGSFYSALGDINRSLEDMKKAESLSPRKQAIIEEKGAIYLLFGQYKEAIDTFQRAYDLDRSNYDALVRLAAAYLYANDEKSFSSIINEKALTDNPELRNAYLYGPLLLQVAYIQKRYDIALDITETRAKLEPQNVAFRTNLAAIYMEQGNKQKAIEVLEQAIKDIPSFREQGTTYINQLKVGSSS